MAQNHPFAQIRGNFVNRSDAENAALAEEALNDPAWTQVGFDPGAIPISMTAQLESLSRSSRGGGAGWPISASKECNKTYCRVVKYLKHDMPCCQWRRSTAPGHH